MIENKNFIYTHLTLKFQINKMEKNIFLFNLRIKEKKEMSAKNFFNFSILLIILMQQITLIHNEKHSRDTFMSKKTLTSYKRILLDFLVKKIVENTFSKKDFKLVNLAIAFVIKERDNKLREEEEKKERDRKLNTVYWYSRQG